jgi:hypothetical protein
LLNAVVFIIRTVHEKGMTGEVVSVLIIGIISCFISVVVSSVFNEEQS